MKSEILNNRFNGPGKEVKTMTSITSHQSMRLRLQHHFNSLHVYSCICNLHISKEKAMQAAKVYEIIVHPFLYLYGGR